MRHDHLKTPPKANDTVFFLLFIKAHYSDGKVHFYRRLLNTSTCCLLHNDAEFKRLREAAVSNLKHIAVVSLQQILWDTRAAKQL